MTTSLQGNVTVTPGKTTVTVPAGSTSVVAGTGLPGPPGAGVNLAGAVAEYADLPQDLGVADAGAAYVVQSNGKLYVWSGMAWPAEVNGADFRGEQGLPGRGIDAITLQGDDMLRFAMSDTTAETVTIPAITAAAASASAASASASAAAGSASAAAGSATDAATAATAAELAQTDAETARDDAESARDAAAGSASAAAGSASAAAASASDAEGSANAAAGSESNAAASASAAGLSETAAQSAQSAAESARDDAEDARDAAASSASAAAGSASDAAGSASTASAAASTATGAASTATSAASDAEDARDAAAGSASAAAGSATDASGSATAAAGSATAAATSASNAATSETNAAGSASAAAADAATAQGAASTATGAKTAAEDARDLAEHWAQEAASTVLDGVPNATDTTKGGILLAGDLAGTWDAPTVPALAAKADLVGGKIPSSQIPAIATTETHVVASTAERLALSVQRGDVAVQTGNPGRGTYILQGDDPANDGDWVIMAVEAAVSSVNGYQGIVVLDKADVGLGQVDNTSDANKPVSTAQATALAGKSDTGHKHAGADITSGTVPFARLPVGTGANTVAAGDDSRLTNARPPTSHSHPISEVTGLQSALDGKAAASHTHTMGQVTGLDAALNGKTNGAYTIAVSGSAPGGGTPSTTITFVTG